MQKFSDNLFFMVMFSSAGQENLLQQIPPLLSVGFWAIVLRWSLNNVGYMNVWP